MKITNDDNYPTSIIIHDTRAVLVNTINVCIKKPLSFLLFSFSDYNSSYFVIFQQDLNDCLCFSNSCDLGQLVFFHSRCLPPSLSPSDLPIGIRRKCPYVSNIAGPLCSSSIIFSCYLLLHSLEPEVEVTRTVTQSRSDKRHSRRCCAEYRKSYTK